MKYTSKKLPNSVVELEAILDHKEFLNYYQPVYDQAVSAVELKGFRPGAAPKDLSDKAIDKEKVFNEAAVRATRDSLKEITAENSWQLINQPMVEVLETNPKDNIGLKFKATITVFPEVKLGNYKKIAKKVLSEKKSVKVEEKEIEETIKWVLNSRAKLARANHPAEKGNLVDIDFTGFLDGKPLDGASGKADGFILGEGKFVPGFEDNLYGRKEGDKPEFSVNFPEDYWKEDLRGKKIDFKVEIKGIFDRQVPELNDDFVKSLGKFENAENFKKNIRDGITKEKENKEKERLRLKIMEEIIKDSKIELPEIMVNRTLDDMAADYKNFLKSSSSNKNSFKEDDIRKNLEEKAKNSVATNLVLYQISKAEHLEPTAAEVETEANEFLKNNRFDKKEKIDQQKINDYSYGIAQNRKVFEYLESLQ